MKTMKRLLALLLALSMVMPNCLTIASAYDEEIVEEVVEELAEEITETPEEVVEEVFEEVYEEEIYEEAIEEEIAEEEENVVTFTTSTEVAAEQTQEKVVTFTTSSDEPLDHELLFAAYANSVFYPEHQPVTLGTAGKSMLTDDALALYEDVENQIKSVANGDISSTSFELTPKTMSGSRMVEALDAAVAALLVDMPFYLYWYDKTTGGGASLSAIEHENGDYTWTKLSFAVNVSFGSGYEVDTSKTAAAINAAAYAAQVAESAIEDCTTDYEKLLAYANWIRDNVEYNHDVVGTGKENYFHTTDGNPWQLIWVFDNNPESDALVVCEGYAKAFQYLCDLAWPEDSLCINVQGDMAYDGQTGAHMWNIVTMANGKNYLVDITQYDSKGGLNDTFMKGASGSITKGYVVDAGADDLTYTYTDAVRMLMGDRLILSGSDYVFYTPETLAAALTAGSTVTLSHDLTISGLEIPAGASLVVEKGAVLTLDQGRLTNNGTFTVSEGAGLVNNGTVVNYGTMHVNGDYSDSTGAFVFRLNKNVGTAHVINGVDFSRQTGNVVLEAGDSFMEDLTAALGYANTYGSVVLVPDSGAEITGNVTIPTNVILRVFGGRTLTVAQSATVQVAGELDLMGTLVNNGSVVLAAGGKHTGDGTVSGNPVSDGTVPEVEYTEDTLRQALANGGTVTLSNDLTIQSYFMIPAGTHLIVAEGATVTVANGASLVAYEDLNTGAYGTLTVNGTLHNYGSVQNQGEMTINGSYAGSTGVFVAKMVKKNGQYVPRSIVGLQESEQSLSTQISNADGSMMQDLSDALAYFTGSAYQTFNFTLNDDVTIDRDITIPAGVTAFNMNSTVTIAKGKTLTIEGALRNNGIIINNGTIVGEVTGTGSIVEGSEPEVPVTGTEVAAYEDLLALMEQDAADGVWVLTEDAVVTGSFGLNGGNVYTIPEDITLTVAEGAELVAAIQTELNVLGALNVKGTLTNNGIIHLQSANATASFAEGSYIQGQNMDGNLQVPAEFVLNYDSSDSLEQVTGLDHGYITLYHNSWGGDSDQPVHIGSVINEMAKLCKGDSAYRNYIINIFGYTEIIEYTEITENGFVRLRNGGELVIGAGTVLRNNGTFKTFGAEDGASDSIIWNHGILENGPNGIMEIWGTYNHNGELKIYTRLGENGLEINDISGIENNQIKSIITELEVTETDQLNIMDQGFAFGEHYGQAQVHVTGNPHFIHGLHLGHNWDLHIYGDAVIDGDVVMEGGQLQVEPGASLTTNDAMFIMQGAYVNVHSTYDSERVADGVFNANGPIHIGFDTKPSEDGSWATGVLDVCGVLNANDYVNICKDAHLNVYGTMTQKDVIIENHGLLNIEGGTLNQNHDIESEDGQILVSGTLNNVSGNIWNNVMTVKAGAKLKGFDLHNQIMFYDGAKLILEDGVDLTGVEEDFVNVRMDDGSKYSDNIDNKYIYAVWFPDNTAELKAAIEASEYGTKYGYSQFIPEKSFELTENITIYPNSLLQLWNHDASKTFAVTVPAGVTLATAGDEHHPGEIIINAGTQILVKGTLTNSGITKVTNGRRGDDFLEPGILQIADEGSFLGNAPMTIDGGRYLTGSQEAGKPYLSTYWVHNMGEGAFVNHFYPENTKFRMTPGEQYSWIFYYNVWDKDAQTWVRTPVDPDALSEGDYVTIEPVSDKARGDYAHLEDYFVMVSIEDVAEAWNKGTVVRYYYGTGENDFVDYEISIEREANRGFYSSDVITGEGVNPDELWLHTIYTSPLHAAEDGTYSFYFHYTGNGAVDKAELAAEDSFAALTEMGGNVWKITLSKAYVDSLWNNKIKPDDRIEVFYGDADNWKDTVESADINIQAVLPRIEGAFGMALKDENRLSGYNRAGGKWIRNGENGPAIATLPEGFDFDYENNVLTLTNVNISALDIGYSAVDQQTGQSFTNLVNENLTIKLVGDNVISNSSLLTGMRFWGGIHVTIMDGTTDGTGTLTIQTDDEHHTGGINVAADSTLNLVSGTIRLMNMDFDMDGVVNLSGATLWANHSGFLVDQKLNMTGGKIELWSNSALAINAMADITGGTIKLNNSVMRVMTGANISNATIDIDVDGNVLDCGEDGYNYALWIDGYMGIGKDTTITIDAVNFADKYFYAVKNVGTYHQMGGNVTVNSDASAALNGEIQNSIPAMLTCGEALLNAGTLTVNGQVGYEQCYYGEWHRQGEQRLEVSGNAVLNAKGTAAGIFVNGPVVLLGGQVNATAEGSVTATDWPMAVAVRGNRPDGQDRAYLDIQGGTHNLNAIATDRTEDAGKTKALSVVHAPVYYSGGTVKLQAEMALHSVTAVQAVTNFVNHADMMFLSGEDELALSLQTQIGDVWLQTLNTYTDGVEAYATDVTIARNERGIEIRSEEAWNALTSGIPTDTFSTGRNINIYIPVTIQGYTFRLTGSATMTIMDGGSVTIENKTTDSGFPVEGKLEAADQSKIVVKDGGKIAMKAGAVLSADMGSILLDEGATYQSEGRNQVIRAYRDGVLAVISGISLDKQSLAAYVSSMEQYWAAIGMADDGYASAFVTGSGDLTITGTMTLSENIPLFLEQGANLTIAEGAELIVPNNGMLSVPFGNLVINGKLTVHEDAMLAVNGAKVTVGENGELVNNMKPVVQENQIYGGLNIAQSAVLDVRGKLTNSGHLAITNNTVLTVNGLLNNFGSMTVGMNDAAQLNINGTLNNHGRLDLDPNGMDFGVRTNVSGVLNNKNGTITNGGFLDVSGTLNIDGGEMRQNHTLIISGSANIRGKLDTRGRTVLEGGKDFGATMIVGPGGSVELIHMGKFLVQSGAAMYNGKDDIGNGNVQIVMGTLYVEEGGKYEGPSNGDITYPGSDKTKHLSAYWVNGSEEEGWQVQPEHGIMREMRMVPGGEYYIAIYVNEWVSDRENGEYYWRRNPAYLELNGYEHLTLEPLLNGALKVTVKEDAWGNTVKLNWQNALYFPIYIGTDSTHGFYKAAVASNENWLEDITVNNLSKYPADMVVYFLLTDADKVMTGAHSLEVPEGVVVKTEYQNDGKTIKVTIPGSTIKTLSQSFWLNMNYDVQPRNGGNVEHWDCGIQINCTELHQLQRDAWMRINGRDYSYNAANDIWMMEGKIVTLPNMSYDYDSNTLTMNGADLTSLEVSCYGVDEETNELNGVCEALPRPELTLVLKGENKIQSNTDSALKISTGVKLNITGDGSLYLLTDNGTGTEALNCSTIHMVNDETLTISGNAQVTVEVKGKTADGYVSAVQGASALTVKDNAVLTTVLPENGNRYDDINRTGGYSGLNEFRNIYIQGGTVNTQFIGTGNYEQSGGTVNIEPLPELRMDDNWQWDDQKQENVNQGKVSNTNFDALYTNGGTVTISGGALNITIPNRTITTERTNYRGIGMDGGTLNINGGVITIDTPAGRYGNGINLSRRWDDASSNTVFNMNGGRVVMQEAVFADGNRTVFLKGDGNAEVYISGGIWELDGVSIDLNGKTEWNNGVLNGEEILFLAGGPKFTINGGEINLTGKAMGDGYSNSLFRAHGMVTMNGGEINIENGVLGVPTSFVLNGGNVSIHNDVFENQYGGLYVGNNLEIHDGTLTVHTPGGYRTFTENDNTWEEDYPAVYVDGVLHQMGGTVNFTNDGTRYFSAAIRSNSNIYLHGGTMNLKSNYGIDLYGNGDYSDNSDNKEFLADGGTLNIDAADSGILSRHASVRFVSGQTKNGEVTIPVVNIHSGAGALQLLTDEHDETIFRERIYVNEYSFVNTDGRKLVMESKDRRDEPAAACWIHTLMDGDYYATNAILKDVVTRTEDEFWAEVAEAEGTFQLTYDVTITKNYTLTKPVEVMAGAELIVAPGAVLTLQNKGTLAAVHGGKITVQAEGQINNESAQLTNFMGTITINHGKNKMGYVENQKGQMHMQTYSQNGELLTGTTIGWPNASQTLNVTCETLDQYERAIGITTSRGYGGTFVDFYNDIDMNRYVTIPGNVTVSINNPHELADGTVNTGSEVSIFTVKNGQTLTIEGALFVNNGAKLVVEQGAILRNNEGGLHVGDWQNGNFETSGTLDVYGTANLEGYTAIHNFEKRNNQNDEVVYIPGVMNVYGTVNTNPVEDPMNGGFFQNFGVLNVESSGVINSNFMFDTIGTTNVKSGASVNLTNGMMVTGVLDVAGTLTNEKGILHVGSLDEANVVIPGNVNVTGTLTNKGIVSVVHRMTVSGALNNVGGIFLDSDSAKLTATGTVTNAGCIDSQIRSGTIDFAAANYLQEEVEYDGIPYQGELIVDYGTTFNTTVRQEDKGEVTLRYAGSDLATAQNAKTYAANNGFRDFIWAVTADVTIPATSKGEAAVTVAAGDCLVVAPGVTLTIEGELNNAGSLVLAKHSGSDLAGALVIGEKAKLTNVGSITTAENSSLTNNGTIKMENDSALKVNGTYTASDNGFIRMELDAATVTGVNTQDLTVIRKITDAETAQTELNEALTCDSSIYKTMEIVLTAVVNSENNSGGLKIEDDLVTIAGNKKLVIGAEGADAQPVVTITNNVVNKGILTNYGDLFIGDLVNDGAVNNYGTLCAGGEYSGVCGPDLTWKLTANANVFARTAVPTALVISGTGEMTSTPWNDKVLVETLKKVATIKLSNQLTNIMDGAFVNFTGVNTITIPKSVVNDEDERHVTRDAFVTDSTNLKLMIYHTFDKTSVTGITKEFIHELVEGECRYCDYTTAKLAEDVATAVGMAEAEKNADAVVAVLNTMDTAALKQQVESEMSSGTTTVTKAIKQADAVVQEQNNVTVSKDDNSQHVTITENPEGAALSAREKNSQVTLVVNDVPEAPPAAPAVYRDEETNTQFANAGTISVDMTLTGVDDPENLTAPVTITLQVPAACRNGKFAIIHHGVGGAEQVNYKLDKENGTVTFTVDSFSTFEFTGEAAASVALSEDSPMYPTLAEDSPMYPTLAEAIENAPDGATVTMMTVYDGAAIRVDKKLTIVPGTFQDSEGNNIAGITIDQIVAGNGFDKKMENGNIEIFAVEAEYDDVKYESLADAIAEAKKADGTETVEITLLRSVKDAVSVSVPMTILRGNNFTANITATSTETALAVTVTDTAYVIGPAVAQLKGVNYGSFEAALTAAQDGDVITLFQNVDCKETVQKEITVLLGGNTLTLEPETGYIRINDSANDSSRFVKAKAKIGEVYYATLADAMKIAANADQILTITMLGNDAEPCAVTVPVIIVKGDHSINLTLAEDLFQSVANKILTIDTAEATVGSTGYGTLREALDAANGGTVTLLKDINSVQTVEQEVTIITQGKKLDVTTTAGWACIKTNSGYRITKATAKVVSGDSEIGYASFDEALKAAAVGSTIILLDNVNEVTVNKAVTIVPANDKTKINAARYFAVTATDNGFNVVEAEAEVTVVKDGEKVGAKGYATLEDALAAVKDAEDKTVTLLKTLEGDSIQVEQEVTIVKNGKTAKLIAASDFALIDAPDRYQIVPAVAKIGDTGYATLEAALNAVKNAEDKTITLLQEIEGKIVIRQEVTIDKNGKTAELSTTSDFIWTVMGESNQFVLAKARIGDTVYATLTAALEAAKETDTIVLLAKPAENEKIAKNVKIDLNGVMETVPVADQWEAAKGEDDIWTVQKKPVAGIITDTGRTLALEGVIYINQYAKIEGFEGVDLEKNGGLLIWTSPITEENATYGTQNIEKPGMNWVEKDKEYHMKTHGIPAAEYADNIWLRVYVKDNDGNYTYGPLKEYSVRTYCEGRLKKSSNIDMKRLCVAMLNYGAAAQINFGHNVDDLANKNISDEDFQLKEWDNGLLNSPEPANTQLVGSGTVKDNGKTLELEGAIRINYYFALNTVDRTVKSAELQFWDGVTGELTAGNVSYTKNMVKVSNEYTTHSNDIPASEYGKTIYVRAHFVDTEGRDHYSDVIAYNPEKYAEGRLNKSQDENLKTLVKKMVIYGEYARIYFAK